MYLFANLLATISKSLSPSGEGIIAFRGFFFKYHYSDNTFFGETIYQLYFLPSVHGIIQLKLRI